jgi:hypothetical protein
MEKPFKTIQENIQKNIARRRLVLMAACRGKQQMPWQRIVVFMSVLQMPITTATTAFEMRSDAGVVRNYGRLLVDLASVVPDGLVSVVVPDGLVSSCV